MNATTTCPGPVCLQEYLLGRLSEATAADVERHLASCPECRLAGDLHGLFHNLPASRNATPPADREATPAPASPAVEEAVGSNTLPQPPRPQGDGQPLAEGVADDVGALLAPPREPDELGRLGDYRVLKVLGSGGMGVVFLAEDTRLRRRVALKVMKPALAASANARQRFLREAQLMASLSHDHVVAIHQVGEQNGVPFLAMPLLQGESLDARLKREGRLPLPEVLRIGREAAEGLAAAHERGLIHRDVKPANLWLETLPGERGASTPRYRVKVLDFGLARSSDGDAQLTQSGVILGTPAYMAPEQAGGRVDHRADLFSLGCVLYRMATGQLPFEGVTPPEVLRKAATEQPFSPRELNPKTPPALSDLILSLLAKEPALRPQSAGEVIQALQTLQKDLVRTKEIQEDTLTAAPPKRGAVAIPMAAPVPAVPPRRHRLGVLAGLLLGGLAVAAVAAVVVIIRDKNGNKVAEVNVPDGGKVDIVDDGNKGVPAVVLKPPLEDAWVQQVAALTTAKQVDAVAAKLKELNHDFDGKVTPQVDGGVVTELQFVTDNVTDLSPVRALTGLQTLHCGGSDAGKGRLSDLSPLKDMKLTFLDCEDTSVSDLSPLKGMPLTRLCVHRAPVSDLSPLKGTPLMHLECSYTKVSDLSPLQGMPLRWLNFSLTQVSDLSPLQGMPLEVLSCGDTPVSDLSPLKGMPLEEVSLTNTLVADLSPLKDVKLRSLDCSGTKVSDLSPLRDMQPRGLYFRKTPVRDLSPLKDMKLWRLACNETKVSDLSLLKGLPLIELECDFKPERDAEILRSIMTLEQINGKPVKDFWKDVDEKRPDKKP